MRNTLVIAAKEVRAYVTSPMAYVVTAVFLAVSGLFFADHLSQVQQASMQGFFSRGSFFLLLLAPVLTMRLLAEEQQLGTIELLLTAPVRDSEVVLGKFLASFAIVVGMLLLTLYYPLMLLWFGDPDLGPIGTGYLGLLLLGACYLAVGVLASSLTNNQIVAAVLALGVLILLWVMSGAAAFVQAVPLAGQVLRYLSISTHYGDFMNGVLDTSHVVYYLTFLAAGLFLAIRSLETRRWR